MSFINGRRGAGAELFNKYIKIACERISLEMDGILRTRSMHKPVYDPKEAGNKLTIAPWAKDNIDNEQKTLFKSES